MIKITVVAVLVIVLSGCGWFDRKIAAVTGTATSVCLDGVSYLQFTSGTSVAYTREGKIKTCVH